MSRKKASISELNIELIGGRIAYIRVAKNMNQKEFGDVIGLSKGNISCFENHKYSPSFDVMVRISEQFSVNPEWLMFGRGDIFSNNPTDDESASQQYEPLKIFENKPLIKEIHEILRQIEIEDNECLKEIKGFLRSELNRVKGGNLLKTAEQQFKELENRIARIEQAAHIHEDDKLRKDDPQIRKRIF